MSQPSDLKPPAHHMGTAVKDMESMVALYCDVMGFEVELRADTDEMTADQRERAGTIVDAPDAAFEAAFLDTPGCSAFVLESDRLADFKRPRKYYFVDELPKNPSGKVQTFKLHESEAQLDPEAEAVER